jgi:type VI secretion system protein ImpG
MDSLLPYYERELTYLRRLSQDFAKRYPKVANRLLLSGETCEDPHVERLIESFAFLTSRIHKKLDDDFPEITDSLLSVVYPQYLRPFPSASIAHFDLGSAAAQLTKPVRIPRGTVLNTQSVRGVPCRFRMAYDLDLIPVQIAAASYETTIDTNGLRPEVGKQSGSAIRLDLACLTEAGWSAAGAGKLRLFLNGDVSLASSIRESLFTKATGIWVTAGTMAGKIELPVSALQPVGFAENETLLDSDARTHHACMLMLEYLAYPEKFNFVDVDLSALGTRLPPHTREITLRIGLKAEGSNFTDNLLDRIGKDNFVIGCTPVINLFTQMPEPIGITNTASSYPIVVDSRRQNAFDVYSIDRVFKVKKTPAGDQIKEFRPFYSVQHGQQEDSEIRYWHVGYGEEQAEGNPLMQISLVDSTLNPQSQESSTLSLNLTCTNKDLPSQLPFGLPGGDLHMEGGSIAKAIRFLRKPTPTYRFPRGRGAQWRMISHLSLNHLSLTESDGDTLREMLMLYNITNSVSNNKQISGIVSVTSKPVTTRIAGNPFPTFVRGLEISVSVDESHFVGIGLFMFAQVLDHFFGLYVHTNSFTRLVLVSAQSGMELIRCQPRCGESILA